MHQRKFDVYVPFGQWVWWEGYCIISSPAQSTSLSVKRKQGEEQISCALWPLIAERDWSFILDCSQTWCWVTHIQLHITEESRLHYGMYCCFPVELSADVRSRTSYRVKNRRDIFYIDFYELITISHNAASPPSDIPALVSLLII